MKTKAIFLIALSTALSVGLAAENESLTKKTTDTLEKAGQKTTETLEKTGQSVLNTGKKATDTVTDAVMPDARKIEVRLTGRRIEMPDQIERGRTAFVVTNSAAGKRSFEITGEGIDKKFMSSVGPSETKTMHIDLKPGTYKVTSPGIGGGREEERSLLVK
jgi:hypothetical protein